MAIVVGVVITTPATWRYLVVKRRIDADWSIFQSTVQVPAQSLLTQLNETAARLEVSISSYNEGGEWSETIFGYMAEIVLLMTKISKCVGAAQTMEIFDRGWGWKEIINTHIDEVGQYLNEAARQTDLGAMKNNSRMALLAIEGAHGAVVNSFLEFKRRQDERFNPLKRH